MYLVLKLDVLARRTEPVTGKPAVPRFLMRRVKSWRS